MNSPYAGSFWRKHQSFLLLALTVSCSGLYVACSGNTDTFDETGPGPYGGPDATTDGAQGDSKTDSQHDALDEADDAPTSNAGEGGL